jgi:hypothetical protein
MAVLNTTSPVVLPLAPMDRPWKTVPSSSASTAATLSAWFMKLPMSVVSDAHADGEMALEADPA